jgi:hypothetical protein
VPDVTTALGQLARHALTRIKDVTVIALTGSAGKTNTKDILARVLARHGATVAARPARYPARDARLTRPRQDAIATGHTSTAPSRLPSKSTTIAVKSGQDEERGLLHAPLFHVIDISQSSIHSKPCSPRPCLCALRW